MKRNLSAGARSIRAVLSVAMAVLASSFLFTVDARAQIPASPESETEQDVQDPVGFSLPVVGSHAKWGETYRAEDRFPPPPRQLARALSRGYEAYAAGEMLEAVGWLQQVIERPGKEDFLLRGPSADGTVVSMNWATHVLFCSLPAKERELFQIRHQAAAKRALDEAVANRDTIGISEVMRKYLYTEAGIEAGLLLGYEHFQHGRPGLASSIFRRLRMIPEARRKHDPNLSVLLALCCVLSDQEAQAEQILREIESFSDVRLPVAVGDIGSLSDAQQALNWLQQIASKTGFQTQEAAGQWLVSGGTWSRSMPSGSGFPLKRCRWQVPRINDVQLEKAILETVGELDNADSALAFTSEPVVVGQTVIVRSYETVMGIDLSSGRRIWYYPAIDQVSGFGSQLSDVGAIDVRDDEISLWLNRQGGADDLASDGTRVFLVEHEVTDSSLNSGLWINGSRSMVSGANHLTALNVAKQGSLEWVVGGSQSNEPSLKQAYFLGPPLPIRDHVYCLVYIDSMVQLVQLEAATGRLVWQQALASVDSVVRLDEGSQQCLSPSYANGILVCPTGLGAAVGIDLATRELAWGVTYQQRTVMGRYSRSQRPASRWLGPAVQIVGKYAILSPQESDHLFCVDLVSGAQAWSNPATASGRRRVRTANNIPADQRMLGLDRGEYQLVTGGNGETILNLASNKVRSISLAEGRVLWEKSLPASQRISGQGFYNRGKIWLPTSAGMILQMDMQTGEVEEQLEMPWPIHSLVCTGREIVATSLEHVGAFYQGQVVEAMFSRLADEEPQWVEQGQDFDETLLDGIPLRLIVFRSQLLRHQKKWRPAIALLDYVCRKDWTEYREQLLTAVVLEALRDDAKIGDELFNKYERFLKAKDPIAVFKFQAEGFLKAGRLDEAAGVLLEMAKLPMDSVMVAGDGQVEAEEVRLSWPQWAAVKFREIALAYSERGESMRFLERLMRDTQSELSNQNLNALLRRCEVLGRLGVSKQQQLQLAGQLFDARRLTEAQWVLTPLLPEHREVTVERETSVRLSAGVLSAKILWHSGCHFQAMQQLQKLLTAYGKSGELFSEQLEQARGSLQDWRQMAPNDALALQLLLTEDESRQSLESSANKNLAKPTMANADMWSQGWWNTAVSSELRLDVTAVNPVGTWAGFRRLQRDERWGLQVPLRWYPHENRVEASDCWGRPMSGWSFDVMSDRRRDPMSNHLRLDWGTMSVLQFGEELLMVDSLQLNDGALPSEIWIRDLAQRQWGRMPESNFGPVRQAVNFDERYQLYRRGGQLYGAISNLSAEGCLVDTGNNVCYVSTLSGELKWQRPISTAVLSIFQDDESFYLYCEDGLCLQLDKSNGQVLRQQETEIEKDEVAVCCGRYVVCNPKRGPFQLKVLDLVSGQWAWETRQSEVPATKYEVVVDAGEQVVCWASEDGSLKIADLANGHLLVDSKIDKQPITGIELQSRPDSWVVVLKRIQLTNWQRAVGKIQCSPMPESEELLDGSLYCFDKSSSGTTLSMRWQHPVDVKNCCLIDQTDQQMPFAMFACRANYTDRSRSMARHQDLTYMTLLDLRNGRMVFEEVLPSTYQTKYAADVEEMKLDIQFGSMKGQVQWNQVIDQPPVPVSQLDVSKSARLQADIAAAEAGSRVP